MKYRIALPLVLLVTSFCSSPPAEETLNFDGPVPINGTELYIKTVGQGEPLLIVHGGPGLNHKYLEPHFESLADDFTLIYYDQRASGQSSLEVDPSSINLNNFIQDIEGIRDTMQFETINIMAHSWGGLIAMKYAAKYPEKVKSLVLVNSTGAGSESSGYANRELSSRISGADSIRRSEIMFSEQMGIEEIREMMYIGYKYLFKDTSKMEMLDLGIDENFFETNRLLRFMGGELMNFDFHNEISAITAPTLLLYGDYDPLGETAGKKIAESIESSEMVILKDCGHFPFIEKKEEFLNSVRTFLNSGVQ